MVKLLVPASFEKILSNITECSVFLFTEDGVVWAQPYRKHKHYLKKNMSITRNQLVLGDAEAIHSMKLSDSNK